MIDKRRGDLASPPLKRSLNDSSASGHHVRDHPGRASLDGEVYPTAWVPVVLVSEVRVRQR